LFFLALIQQAKTKIAFSQYRILYIAGARALFIGVYAIVFLFLAGYALHNFVEIDLLNICMHYSTSREILQEKFIELSPGHSEPACR